MNEKALNILKTVFGYRAFRGNQEAVIDCISAGKNALVLMPTGGGKSLCYQIPALCLDGLTVVISPLIALMQDQVEGLKRLGIRAEALNSACERKEAGAVFHRILNGGLDLLYVSPERLLAEGFLDFLQKTKIALFAVDEAHCISQWGHDFRPVYTQLTVLCEKFPDVPRLALTATADAATRQDIIKQLKIEDGEVFISSFNRPNISYAAEPRDNEKKQLLKFILNGHREDAGIVYCSTRSRVEDIAAFLQEEGFDALTYHAGLDAKTRAMNQAVFIKKEGVIMVATIAFGMGINKPDIRFVVHMDLPKNIESYYQETGRAGRDGLPAEALLLYGARDIVLLHRFIEESSASEEKKQIEYRKLTAVTDFAETPTCRRQFLLHYFGEDAPDTCENCDNCRSKPETVDATVEMQKLLSCVYRTGASGCAFGSAHIIDVLCGKDTEKVLKFHHDSLSVFGIGKDVSRPVWRTLIRRAVAQRLVAVDPELFTLTLRAEAFAFFKAPAPVLVAKKASRLKQVERKKSVSVNESLLSALKRLRRELAKEADIPAYYIFSDRTLEEMADVKPQTLDEMAEIYGVGSKKLADYGDYFLDVIYEHT